MSKKVVMEELFDIYDDNGMPIGTKARSAVHRDGDWHRVFHCWVIHPSGFVVVQQRSPYKDVFPNRLDISVGGHYSAGETTRDGVREMEEELGLVVAFEDLISLGIRISCAKDGAIVDRQFSDVFFYVSDRDLTEYRFPQDEISGLIAFPIEEGIAFLKGQRESMMVEGVWYDANGILQRETRLITPDLLISTRDQYFLKVLSLARRYSRGDTDIMI